MKTIRVLFTASLLAAAAAANADGQADLGFNGGWTTVPGATVHPVFGASDSVVGTEDGGVLYSGGQPLKVWKYTLGGTIDATFGSGGVTNVVQALPAGASLNGGRGMVRAGNGEIFAVAGLKSANGAGLRLCKFSKTGQPSLFSATQTPCVDRIFSGGVTHSPLTLAVDSQSAIWVLGANGDLVRVLATGQFDPTFAGDRFTLPNAQAIGLAPYSIAIDASDAVFVVGRANQGQFVRGYVAKLVATGAGPQMVAGFGSGGTRLIGCGTDPINNVNSTCAFTRVATRESDVFVVGVGAYLSDTVVLGQLDRTSGADVHPLRVTSELNSGSGARPLGMVVESSGDLIVSGSVDAGNDPQHVFLARFATRCPGLPAEFDQGGFFGGESGFTVYYFGLGVPSSGGAVALGANRLYVGGSKDNVNPKQPAIAAFVDNHAFFDGIFANGFDACQ